MKAFALIAALAASPATPSPTAPAKPETGATPSGLYKGMDYARARHLLMDDGWAVQPHDYEGRAPIERYPELDCGNGWQSVCTVGYGKDGRTLFLTLDPRTDDALTVVGADTL